MKSFIGHTLTRAVGLLLGAALLLGNVAAYRHFVPTGVKKYITLDHEMRRLFSRAERENFRTAVKPADGAATVSHVPRGIGHGIPSVEFIVADYEIATIQQSPLPVKTSFLDFSPVLNL